MAGKRYRLPPLNFISGFEAAARNLSFTKAAEELFVTQSAISKQVKALEEHLGVVLFERRTRELVLTTQGRQLYRVATELLGWLQEETDKIAAAETKAKQIAVTASTGFTSLWLIPRLKRFRKLHPDIDVRIAATVEILNLERSRLDVAIRYCRPEDAPEDAIRLFDHVTLPVCSPALAGDPSNPLARPEDLRNHVLLHDTYGALNAYADWESWLAAVGIPDLEPAGAIYFNQYEQMIQAASQGQGVALGDSALLHELMESGALVAPFDTTVAASRTCFIIKSRLGSGKPHVQSFVQWLCNEAKHGAHGGE